ncbi:MAG: hypothetical protein SNI45_01600 [Rikenellaceae bacterium]
MITKRVIIAATLLLATSAPTLWAQVPTVEARVEQDSIGIGDRFTYSITIDRDLVQVVEFPEFAPNEGDPIEFVEALPIDTLSQTGRRLQLRRRYVFAAFEEGRHNLGVASALYVDKNLVDTLYSRDSVMLDVTTFLIDSTSHAIFDLKPQRTMPFQMAEVKGYAKWTILALLILAAAIYGLVRYLDARGKKITDLFRPTPPPPPHIEAIKALEQLHNQKLWQNAKYKEYYSSLTNILRHYISRRYSVAAMEMTSEEIIAAMNGIEDLPSRSSMDLTKLLRDADLVKFAKATPDSEENEAYYLKAYYFVEETKIQEEIDAHAEEELFDVSGSQNNK